MTVFKKEFIMSKGPVSEVLQSAYSMSVLLAGISAVGIQMDLINVKNMNPFQQPSRTPQTSQTSMMSLIPIELPDARM